MKISSIAAAASLFGFVAAGGPYRLTNQDWDQETSGKKFFVCFVAPSEQASKDFIPVWAKIRKEYQNVTELVVSEINCEAKNGKKGGKALCKRLKVTIMPHIRFGTADNHEAYKNRRTVTDMLRFAEFKLVPVCSPSHLDLCDEERKAQFERIMQMSQEELESKLAEQTAANEKLVEDLKAFSAEQQKKKLEAVKGKTLTEVLKKELAANATAYKETHDKRHRKNTFAAVPYERVLDFKHPELASEREAKIAKRAKRMKNQNKRYMEEKMTEQQSTEMKTEYFRLKQAAAAAKTEQEKMAIKQQEADFKQQWQSSSKWKEFFQERPAAARQNNAKAEKEL